MTDKANEQGWGSTVNAAAEQIKSATDAVAEKIRPTVGDAVADGLKTGGEYTKAGIQNSGEALGLKGSKVYTGGQTVAQGSRFSVEVLTNIGRYRPRPTRRTMTYRTWQTM